MTVTRPPHRTLDMIPAKLENHFGAGYMPQLQCPREPDGFLHQGKVTVYNRVEYTDPVMRKTTVEESGLAGLEYLRDDKAYIGYDRQGLEIEFSCEICQAIYTLIIYQHEGNTYVGWLTPLPPRDSIG